MDRPEVAEDLSLVRRGVASTTMGFWLVSLAPVIVASADVHGVAIAMWRSWIGLVLVGIYVLARGQLTWSTVLRCAPAGLCFGGSIGLFFWASQLTSIANASLLTTLQPVVLLIAGVVVFGEHVVARDLILGGLAVAGAIVLVLAGDSGGTGDLRGDVLAMVSVILGAGYFIFGKRVLETVSVTSFMVGMFVWAVLVLTAAGVISSASMIPERGSDWVRVAAVGIGSGAGHLLLNYAQNKAPLNLMAVIQLLVPVNATLLAYWFLDQSVTVFQVVGMMLVIGALAIQTLLRTARASTAEAVDAQ